MPWRQEVTFQLVKRASLLLNLKLINTVICRFWLKASTTLPVPRGLEKRRFWVTQENQKSGPFFLLICLEATNLPTIHPNVWAKLPPKNAESPLSVDGVAQKRLCPSSLLFTRSARGRRLKARECLKGVLGQFYFPFLFPWNVCHARYPEKKYIQ